MQFGVVLLAPAMEFIGSLEVKLKAKALRTIELLRHFGSQLPMPHSRKLADHDLWELRVRYSSNICRLFYFHHKSMIYIITSGYVKKSEKTSQTEIDRAIRIREQFMRGERR